MYSWLAAAAVVVEAAAEAAAVAVEEEGVLRLCDLLPYPPDRILLPLERLALQEQAL